MLLILAVLGILLHRRGIFAIVGLLEVVIVSVCNRKADLEGRIGWHEPFLGSIVLISVLIHDKLEIMVRVDRFDLSVAILCAFSNLERRLIRSDFIAWSYISRLNRVSNQTIFVL